MDIETVIYAIDLFGTAAFAFSGAIRSLDRRPDLVGMLILAAVTAVGGSTVRDVVLDRKVAFLADTGYPIVIICAAAMTFFFPRSLLRTRSILLYCDAIGLGVYAAITASVALATPGVAVLSVVLIATISACTGSIVRDLVIQKETLVLSNELYVTPVIAGVTSFVVADALGANDLAGFGLAMFVTIAIRVAAIRWGIRLPRVLRVEVT